MNFWGQIKIPFYFITTALLLMVYNNCGAPIKALQGEYSFSSLKAGIFWPNQTTTLLESDKIISPLVLNDLDNDRKSESIFLSDSKTHASPVQKVIRIVDSESYSELLNIHGLDYDPSEKMDLFLIDLDQNNSDKELLYVDESGTKIIALDLFLDQPENPRWVLTLAEPIDFDLNFQINAQYNTNGQMQIFAGNNMITMSPSGPVVIYSNQKIDGGWTMWSDWGSCSRACGGGSHTRMRLCASPAPQNGGAFCSGNAIDVRSCNTEPCNITCPSGTHLVIDRCVADIPNVGAPVSSVGGGSGGGIGGGEVTGGGSCPSGKVMDRVTNSCKDRKLQCAIGNGGGWRYWNTAINDYGPCTDLTCYFGRVAVDNKCLKPTTYNPGREENEIVVRSPDNMSITALANQFCSDRGHLKSYRYQAGARRPVYVNQNENGNGGTISHYVQSFRTITCVK